MLVTLQLPLLPLRVQGAVDHEPLRSAMVVRKLHNLAIQRFPAELSRQRLRVV